MARQRTDFLAKAANNLISTYNRKPSGACKTFSEYTKREQSAQAVFHADE
jgi:hypothetical protein